MSVRAASKAFQYACRLSNIVDDTPGRGIMASSPLRTQEMTFSCLFARALDRFLFERDNFGAVLHQVPSRKRDNTSGPSEMADIYIVPMNHGDYTLKNPILQSDVKLADFPHAERESVLYSMNSVTINYKSE